MVGVLRGGGVMGPPEMEMSSNQQTHLNFVCYEVRNILSLTVIIHRHYGHKLESEKTDQEVFAFYKHRGAP